MVHVCRDMERRHLWRGWSRLCRHAASLNAAGEMSASRTAAARAAQAQVVKGDAIAATEKANARGELANASDEAETTAMARDESLRQVDGSSTQAVKSGGRTEQLERGLQEYQKRRARVTVRYRRARSNPQETCNVPTNKLDEGYVAGDISIYSAFLHNSRDPLAAARDNCILSPIRRLLVPDVAGRSCIGHPSKHTTSRSSDCNIPTTSVEMAFIRPCSSCHPAHARQITRVYRDKDRGLLFRGWSRLCLHAASLAPVEGAAAAAAATARAVRAEMLEKEAAAAVEQVAAWKKVASSSADAAEARNKARRQAEDVSILEAALKSEKGESGQAMRAQQERWAKTVVRKCYVGFAKERFPSSTLPARFCCLFPRHCTATLL